MTAPALPASRFGRAARPAAWVAMPLLSVANQYCA